MSNQMSLSDAIRAGAKLAPQAFGVFRSEAGHTCAVTAAHDAIGAAFDPLCAYSQNEFESMFAWPILRMTTNPTDEHVKSLPPCERGSEYAHNLASDMMRWNDCLGWSRERIAAEVELIELHNPDLCAPAPCARLAAQVAKECAE